MSAMDDSSIANSKADHRLRAQELLAQAEKQIDSVSSYLGIAHGAYPEHVQKEIDYATALATLAHAHATLAQDSAIPEQ